MYQRTVRGLAIVFLALGLALLATTLANGGGPASVGVLIGIAFLAVGAARLWLAARVEK